MSAGSGGGAGERGSPWATGLRDAACGQLEAAWEGRQVRLGGWVHKRRDLGGLMFVDLRDRTGLVQLSFDPEETEAETLELASRLSPEDVLQVEGEVARRPEEARNPDMRTGEIEVRVRRARRLSAAEPLPILVAVPPEEALPSEEMRLRHRFLDLRRPEMIRNFETRHRATAAARRALDAEGFLEVETPLLTRRTPEGARDYLVPSREHPGEFYALPQSPQLYKQILMVSGFDRYYQVARCLRDEDLRADRQPEFSQIDVEMAFVTEEDVYGVAERTLARIWREAAGIELEIPFPRVEYGEAMERYGTDRPDLRIPWRLEDLTPVLTGLGFGIFDSTAEAGGRVRGFVAEGGAALSRADLERYDELAREHGAKGALWIKRTSEGWSGSPARFLTDEAKSRLESEAGLGSGDLLFLVAGPDPRTHRPLDVLRRTAGRELEAVEQGPRILWVVRFPMFEPDPETGDPVPLNHPFTSPVEPDPERLLAEPFAVPARSYDVVYNGTELLSGSIRCHDPKLQRAIFRVMGLSEQEMEARFGFLLEAFRYGVPPHGGFAAGLDRIAALLVGADSIREVIAFPKTAAARGLMEGAPSPVEEAELRELGIRVERGNTRA